MEFGNIKLSFSMVFTAHPSVYQGELNMHVVHLKFLIRDSNRFKHRVIIRSSQSAIFRFSTYASKLSKLPFPSKTSNVGHFHGDEAKVNGESTSELAIN